MKPDLVTQFEKLARTSPADLVKTALDPTLSPGAKARAAQALGFAPSLDEVLDALRILVTDEAPVVREGSLYGLASFLPDERAREVIVSVSRDALAPQIIRDIARDCLDEE